MGISTLIMKRCDVTRSSITKAKAILSRLPITAVQRNTDYLFVRASHVPNLGFGNANVANKFRRIDGIPSSYELIYRADFPNYIISIQVLNLFGCLVLLLIFVSSLLPVPTPNPDSNTGDESSKPGFFKQLGDKANEALTVQRTDNRLPTPDPEEFFENDPLSFAVLVFAAFSLSLGLIRLQRRIPIRLYTSRSGHSYAVFYGHIVPTKTTKHEFVAGTLKNMDHPRRLFWTHTLYEDATGHRMILLEHSFRYPVDLKYLMGIKETLKNEDDDDTRN